MKDEGRSRVTVVLAMSADGKIADVGRSPARFGSAVDKAHLEQQIAQADAVLFGAGTLRAYETTLRVTQPQLLKQRQGKPLQPVHLVCSGSGKLELGYRFFQQEVPRWLLTSVAGAEQWRDRPHFERVLIAFSDEGDCDWHHLFQQLAAWGLKAIVVTGGGQLVASLMTADVVDELWLTVCPLVLGGAEAPTPVEGTGFPASLAPRLTLLSVETIEQEVFLHYRLEREKKLN